MSQSKTVETRMSLRDMFTGTLNKINRGTLDYKRNLRDLKRTADQTWQSMKTGASAAAASFGVATAGVVGIGLKTNAEMEKAAKSFEILLESADKAKTMMTELQNLAVNSPFEFAGLQQSSKTLLGMGFAAKDIIPTMISLGEAVAATGGNTETLQGIALAFGQIQAKGKLSAEEVNQLAERGIPVWQLLSKQMGKPTSEIMKMSEQGKLLAKDTLPMIVQGLNEKFGGSMDKMGNTWDFMIANIKESLTLTFADMSFPLFEAIKSDLRTLRDQMTEMKKDGSLQEMVSNFGSALTKVYGGVKAVAKTTYLIGSYISGNWKSISPIVYGIVGAFTAYKLILITTKTWTMAMTAATWLQAKAQLGLNAAIKANPMAFWITLIGLAIAAGTYLINNWELVKLKGMQLWNVVVGAAEWGVNKYIDFSNFMLKVYKFAWDSIEYGGKSIWNGIILAGQAGVNGFLGLVEKMIQKTLDGVNGLIRNVNDMSEWLGLGSMMDEFSFGGLKRVDFAGVLTEVEKPQWDDELNIIPKVDFSKAKFSEDAIMNQIVKVQDERDKKKQKSEEKLIDALDANTMATSDNTTVTSDNTTATGNNTSALRQAKSAEDIADTLFSRIDRKLYGTT